MWKSPVYNRTLFDVQTKSNKGYINTEDLNRIENNMQVMANVLECKIKAKTWQDGEFIYISDFERIKSNLQTLTAAFPLTAKSPQIPVVPFVVYSQWNDIEKIIFDLHSLFYANKEAVYFCGEAYAGSQIGVI